jgi:hypothetical protein
MRCDPCIDLNGFAFVMFYLSLYTLQQELTHTTSESLDEGMTFHHGVWCGSPLHNHLIGDILRSVSQRP